MENMCHSWVYRTCGEFLNKITLGFTTTNADQVFEKLSNKIAVIDIKLVY